ncbi:MAG TPA: hypothetical protein VGH49_13935 [Xanthobacteraceae bacterium]|jgi:putative solute:sodium symporter small subunit
MQNALHPAAIWTDVAARSRDAEQQLGLGRLRRGMLTMLAAWLGYFVIISMSVQTLNRVTVPLLDVPLGVFLAAQGTAMIFLAALVLLVKASAAQSGTR